uniref:Uncharacterized protein n=1 Tax=Onchocerca volvulus TaxID=6282 RepID=A0A8R1XUK2_ONCVO
MFTLIQVLGRIILYYKENYQTFIQLGCSCCRVMPAR